MVKNCTCLCSMLLLLSFYILEDSTAQQMIVDDAVTSDRHAIEFWAGTEESWLQPAIAITPNWNFGPGIIFSSSNRNFEATNWIVESKWAADSLITQRWNLGNVSAAIFNFDGHLSQFYSYIPLTYFLPDQSSSLHLNAGIEGNKLEEWEFAFTSGVRGDIGLSGRVILHSEIFTFNFDTPAFHAGFHFVLIPDRLETDITYGREFLRNMTYPGFNVGISFVP